MTTAIDIIGRALRILRVADANSAIENGDFVTARLALNAMCQRWEADGIALGWSPVSEPDDPLPAPVEAEEAIAYNLALRLRPEYGQEVGSDVLQTAEDCLAKLRRDVYVASPIRLCVDAPNMRGRYNIYTGDYSR